ncbi:trypsin-like peptidase domain-containing protein [Kitasatospora sp. NPDC056184]|uniref:nSTAND1 domain-containing NTPase n=1 Tax=Kitasatospora sp. NPDC056184 TaxID=3345738 RepID=UPI0035E2D420
MASADRPPDGGRAGELLPAVAQVLGPDGEVAGAGFLVAEDVLLTCAHVVRAAGAGPGEQVRLAFPNVGGSPLVEGHVLEEPWREPDGDDVAVVRPARTVPGTAALPLGSPEGCRGHQVRSFGFPAQAPPGGHFGFGVAGDLLPAGEGGSPHLQLTSANDLTTGFSGGPVLDEVTGLVIGMLTEIAAPDDYERGQGIAYVTPAEVLREVWPDLALTDICPYRGLESFTAEEARWFEGRKEAVRQVLANLAHQQRLTLLLGPSGSGKSSLVQAGVLPALAEGRLPGSDRWLPVLARPRQDLPAELERAGLPGARRDGIAAAVTRRLAQEPDRERILLVVDQFEEFLARPTNGRKRELVAAADQLAALADSAVPISVVLVMRDDFYPQLAALAPTLLEKAMPGLLNLPSTLSHDELRDIITLPARSVGAHFEAGLPEQIITDVLAAAPEGAAGDRAPVTVLPLLELTLSQLWQRRRNGFLTHDAYQRVGGVAGGLTTWCDSALRQLPGDQLPIARRILTSLVRPAEPGYQIPAIREQLPLRELRELASTTEATPDSDRAVDDVVAALTRHRIIMTHAPRTPGGPLPPAGQPVAELIHDALIREWGTLQDWVEQDHRFQDWLESTRKRRAAWAERKDPGDLLGGTALAEGLDWAERRRLPRDITEFLTASRQRQQAAIRRSRRLNAILAGLLAVALVAGAGAVWQWRTVATERQEALSRQFAAQSDTLIGTNPDLAALLAIAAYDTSHTPESAESLGNAALLPLKRRLAGSTEPVDTVAFSPDGKTLATAGDDESVSLWDVATGKALTSLAGHTDAVFSVAFSPDGKTLASASFDQTVRLWDVATGKERAMLNGHAGVVFSVAFSPDGKTLASAGGDKSVRLWDAATGAALAQLTGHDGSVFSVAFSPDGKTLASGGDDTTVRLWDVATGATLATLREHTAAVEAVVFSPDGKSLATGSDDTDTDLWDVAAGSLRSTLSGHTDAVTSVAFSPDGKTLATGSVDQTARMWDVATGSTRTALNGHVDSVFSVAFSPDGKTLATGSIDATARLWDISAGTVLTGHTWGLGTVAFSPDGQTLITGSYDAGVRVWDVTTRTVRSSLNGRSDTVNGVAVSPDGKTLATGEADYSVSLWEVATGRKVNSLTRHTDVVSALAFSPDGKTLATGSDDTTVRLWDVATGTSHDPLASHTGAVSAVAFSPDGKTLASGSADRTAQLWDVATGSAGVTFKGHVGAVDAVAFSPDGKTLATGSDDNSARLWDVATGKSRAALTGHSSTVWAVAFSPDGRLLATGSADTTARLWTLATNKSRGTLAGHTDAVYSVAFSPDSRTLATGSSDATARLWDVAPPQPSDAIRKICQSVDRDLTSDEQVYLSGHSVDPVCHKG